MNKHPEGTPETLRSRERDECTYELCDQAKRYLRKRGLALSDAEDVLQDSWLAFVRLRYFDTPQSVWSPLYFTVVESVLVNYFREKARQRDFFAEELSERDSHESAEAVVDAGADPVGEACVSQALGRLVVEINRLPPVEKAVALKQLLNSDAVEDGAAMFGVSEAALKMAFVRAMPKLIPILKETL